MPCRVLRVVVVLPLLLTPSLVRAEDQPAEIPLAGGDG